MDMDKLVSLCKRRGFIFPSSEIYGGINGFWDYGPLGVELKRNIKDAWWRDNVMMRDDMVGLDCSIIMHPKVWEASGHLAGFSDPMVDCRQCKGRFRADQLTYLRYNLIENGVQGVKRSHYFFGLGSSLELGNQNAKKIDKIANSLKSNESLDRVEGNFITIDEETKKRFTCPTCAAEGSLTEPRNFNLMFRTKIGACR